MSTQQNATDCRDIRDNAQDTFNIVSTIYYYANGVWALLLVVLMWVSLSLCQAIITMPIAQRSKESNIPLWLTLPIIGCFLAGYILVFTRTSIEEYVPDVRWVALVFFVSGKKFHPCCIVVNESISLIHCACDILRGVVRTGCISGNSHQVLQSP